VTYYLHGAQPGIEVMKRGPKPIGETAMTHAERQARYRAAHANGAPKVKIKYRKPADRRSRPQRWRDAVAELVELQADCQTWLDAVPENLADGATAEALRAICELDLSVLEIDPPRGFGRD
jgi:hypothetical protein